MPVFYRLECSDEYDLQLKLSVQNQVSQVVGILIGIIFLTLALRGSNIEQLSDSMRNANIFYAPPFVLCLFSAYWLRAQRWALLLKPTHLTTAATLFPIVLIGHLTNLVLPLHMGEVIRTVVASRQTNVALAPMFASVLLARLFDLLVMLAFLAYAGLVHRPVLAAFEGFGFILVAIVIALFCFVLAYLIWTPVVVQIADALFAFLPSAIRERLVNQVELGAQGLQSLKRPVLLAQIAASTVAQWGFVCLCVYLSFRALAIEVPPSAIVLTLAAVILVTLIVPSAPGFIGSIQIAYVLSLSQYGVESTNALAASVYYHSLMYISVLVAGFVCLRRLGYTFSKLRCQARLFAVGDPAKSLTARQVLCLLPSCWASNLYLHVLVQLAGTGADFEPVS